MEPHNIDSTIKNAVEESSNYYDKEAGAVKERIWKQVQFQTKIPRRLIIYRSLAAACILLLISLSVLSVSFIRTKKAMKSLVEINSVLNQKATENNQTALRIKQPEIAANISAKDTIYIERKVIVSRPVIITKQIQDTVYIRQTVYLEKEKTAGTLTTDENMISKDSSYQKTATNYEAEILISNNESMKRRKSKKLQIKFGGNKDQTNTGTLALITKL